MLLVNYTADPDQASLSCWTSKVKLVVPEVVGVSEVVLVALASERRDATGVREVLVVLVPD